jgi:hypothetical protein
MPAVKIARPFIYSHGRPGPKWLYGVGVYFIDDADLTVIMATPALRWNLQDAVVARGDALMQHRQPAMAHYGGSVHYRALSVVNDILAQQVIIVRWPPSLPQTWVFGPDVIHAPGEMLQVLEPDPDGGEGAWRTVLRPSQAPLIPSGYHGSGTPVSIVPHPFAGSFAAPQLSDTVVFGEQPAAPFTQIDTMPPAHPELPASVVALMRMQERAIIMAQTSAAPPPARAPRATPVGTPGRQAQTIARQAEAVIAAQEGWMPNFTPVDTSALLRLQDIAHRQTALAQALPRMRRPQGTLNTNTSYPTTPPVSTWKFGDPVR